MTLEEITQAIQARLDLMAKLDDYPIEDWLRAYEVMAQVKQAQETERCANALEGIEVVMRTGLPVVHQ